MAGNRDYINRRIHSLLGVIPIGIFLIQHLTVNFFATRGPEAFNNAAHFMESLPYRYVLEIFIIFLPILFHGIYGVYIAFTARHNVSNFGYFRNWMFMLQRYTGIITLVFIAWHVWETRIAIGLGWAELNYQLMESILTEPFFFWFYVIGVISTTFHFANGLWSFCVSWGLTITPRSQRFVTYATIIVFLAISYVGVRTLFTFAYGG
ncbi:succinate dehydrogenase cytochrome b558 subunit [Thalassobacillus pellis]|uniref:succinate dehydrogenase cytochrome b558 subunit n=1 Tax=Thalassobacillus pellis TaxID=748008 RepID=UPI00195F2A22|nr:succinate dehydrogenase cytochrome b558 subunit [Thalassobacillus pellis]MBM7555031.1 succinate dehydrogenase / fumarate reductase cytochrome b subunit [Thalassobacillus pellis]